MIYTFFITAKTGSYDVVGTIAVTDQPGRHSTKDTPAKIARENAEHHAAEYLGPDWEKHYLLSDNARVGASAFQSFSYGLYNESVHELIRRTNETLAENSSHGI